MGSLALVSRPMRGLYFLVEVARGLFLGWSGPEAIAVGPLQLLPSGLAPAQKFLRDPVRESPRSDARVSDPMRESPIRCESLRSDARVSDPMRESGPEAIAVGPLQLLPSGLAPAQKFLRDPMRESPRSDAVIRCESGPGRIAAVRCESGWENRGRPEIFSARESVGFPHYSQ